MTVEVYPQPHKTKPQFFARRAFDGESRVVLRTSVDQVDQVGTLLSVHSFSASRSALSHCSLAATTTPTRRPSAHSLLL